MRVDKIPGMNSAYNQFDYICCVNCGKSCGHYPRTDQEFGTKLFVCRRCMKRKITCPSCLSNIDKAVRNDKKTTSRIFIFDCECMCKRKFEAVITLEYLHSYEDLKIVKKIKRG